MHPRACLLLVLCVSALAAWATAAPGAEAGARAAPGAAAEAVAAMVAAAAASAAESGSGAARRARAEAAMGAEAEAVGGGWARVVQLVRRCRPGAAGSSDEEDASPLGRIQRCLVDGALTCLDEALGEERLPLAPGVVLVRLPNSSLSSGAARGVEGAGGGGGPLNRAMALLRTYSLRTAPAEPEGDASQGRTRRRHYRQMFPLMVMSFMALSSFMVPLGFQFMAVLGGKALLLSKMALLVASMLTYKKLATDFSHHAHGHGHHDPYYYGWHDRSTDNKWSANT